MKPRIAIVTAMLLCTTLCAEPPVSGRPVPNLSYLDTIMTGFMDEPSRTISAGVLGVSRGGKVVFLHAYGNLSPGVNLPETAIFRLASVVKPITGAAIQNFARNGGWAPPAPTPTVPAPTAFQRPAFNLSGNGGLLNVTLPAGKPLGDARYAQITVGHLLDHVGGWDRSQPWPGDIPIDRVRNAGIEMNEPDAVPTRGQLVGWALQYALDFAPGAASYTPTGGTALTPGAGTTYSNFGYLILGEILEAIAPGGYVGYLRDNIMSAANWIPSTDWGPATTLQVQNNPREPRYESTEGTLDSVFDYTPPIEQLPAEYGGDYHIETMLAHGGLIASAQAMLRFGSLYRVAYVTQGAGATQSNNIGVAVAATGFPAGSNPAHTGSLPGASTILRQRGRQPGAADDEVIFIAFNKRSGGAADWASDACNLVTNYLDIVSAAETWPTEKCDGFWVTLGVENATAGFGGYHSRYQGFQSALNRVTNGSDLRLQTGTQHWTGTISKRLRIDAPEGAVTLGL